VNPIRIAVVGMGKIARDQHVPALSDDDGFTLAATVSPDAREGIGLPHFETLQSLLESGLPIDAAVLCTPPQVRYALAASALEHGLHVLLEKPPGATVGEVEALKSAAAERGATLFASWHSRFAPAVEPARAWLSERRIGRVSVTWHEDVRVWHPGQIWIWEPGGLGVFDPGINALSILTHILPQPILLTQAALAFPANRATPIAADLAFRDASGVEIIMDLDFRVTGPQCWTIAVETDAGPLRLEGGGSVLRLPAGATQSDAREYPALYRHFGDLIRAGVSDVDMRPLQLVADAFLYGARRTVEPFLE
jgi:D-galactose 1-dehydrogenase